MHYTGTIWRPPYEADSLLLEVTAGCTHHKCKFCTLYCDLPFKFRMSPIEDIENDLLEAQVLRRNPYSKMLIRLQGKDDPDPIRRVFLTGANPFVLKTEKLLEIASLIHKYFPSVNSIGCFARITDSVNKTDDELIRLHRAGYNGLTIGVETADNEALAFMRTSILLFIVFFLLFNLNLNFITASTFQGFSSYKGNNIRYLCYKDIHRIHSPVS